MIKRILPLVFLSVGGLAMAAESSAPRYFSVRSGALVAAKAQLAAGDAILVPALQALQRGAAEALQVPPPSVTEKTRLAPSGDVHDYASTAPYFWPDPSKPDGLPYLAHDGKVNPESRTAASDLRRIETMSRTVETLALAYYFTGKEAYAAHAARCLRVWFLEPATSMNPHLEYGQGVPGKSSGRNIGVIEGGNLPSAAEAAGLLLGSEAWTAKEDDALKAWMARYLEWLLTSQFGREEAAMPQNHGTLYDVQVMRLALLLGRTELAREVAEAAKARRVAVQIEPDGRQPMELKRTKAFSSFTPGPPARIDRSCAPLWLIFSRHD